MSFQDAASLVAQRLKLEKPVSSEVLERTQSALRVLKYRNPNGTFGKLDNDLKRACALLEYNSREIDGIKIPMAQLSKAAFMKEREFVKFHQKVGNFRSSWGGDYSNSTKSLISGANSRSKNHTCGMDGDRILSRKVIQKSSIPSLAIKLGSYVQDSNGAALRAQRLYNDILRFSRKNPHQLKDMIRFKRVYEAVCFYLMATKDYSGEVGDKWGLGVRSLSSTKNLPSNKDDDEAKQLSVSTVLAVSNDFTLGEFRSILEHIQSITERMKAAKVVKSSTNAANIMINDNSNKSKAATAATKKRPNKASQKRKSRINDTNNSDAGMPMSSSTTEVTAASAILPKRKKTILLFSAQQLACNITQDLLSRTEDIEESPVAMESLNDDPFAQQYGTSSNQREDTLSSITIYRLPYSPKFLEWKRQILSKATRATSKQATRSANETVPFRISDSSAIDAMSASNCNLPATVGKSRSNQHTLQNAATLVLRSRGFST